MFGHYLTVGWRNLRRNPLYSLINVFGLSIAVAASVLIFLFVQDELTFDSFHAKGDQIYRVVRAPKPNMEHFELNLGKTPYLPAPLAAAAEEEIQGVADAVRLQPVGKGNIIVGDQYFKSELIYADPNLFDMFSFDLLAGNEGTALSDPTAAVISMDAAIRYFGSANILGKSIAITLWDIVPKTYQITGVLAEFPSNSTIAPEVLLPMSASQAVSNQSGSWNGWNFHTYLLLAPTADPSAVQEKISRLYEQRSAAADKAGGIGPRENPFTFELQALRDVHLNPETGDSKLQYSYILGSIAVALLLIACINFVTLAMARSTTRAREVSVRKVFGAVRRQLVSQFWGEGLLLSAAALIAGLVLAELALPLFNSIADKSLGIQLFANWPLTLLLLTLLILLGLASGSVPALVLSRLQPASIFRERARLSKSGPLARALVVVQYGLSVALLICLWGMYSQYRYIESKPLGYNSEHVVVLANTSAPDTRGDELTARLRQELAFEARVLNVAACDPSFVRGWGQMEWNFHDQKLRTFVYTVDHEYIPILGIALKEGRNFSPEMPTDPTNAVIVNEAFVRKAGLDEPIGAPLAGYTLGNSETPPVIVGVTRDYHVMSLHDEIEPVMLTTDPSLHYTHILVRVDGNDLQGTLGRIESAWNKVTGGSRFDYSFLDDDLTRQYLSEQRWLKIVGYSAGVTVVIATLGLFGLAGVSAVRRMKEISIRKVLGATMPQVLRTLNTEFLWLIVVSNALAWPTAYFILNRWLQNFAYRTELSPWSFVLAAGIAIVVAGAAISFHTIRAASVNPAAMLRRE